MDFFRKTKGAVSIFLVIILLPVMTVAGLFLDVSRVSLSKEVVSTSADLALNTVLSDYDKTLKDYFGLLASCQSTDEVVALSKQYFIDSMVSAGVTTSDAEAYYDEVASLFTEDADIRDMLQLSVDGDVSITRTPNGAMNNPALIKEGIVEFMKYRAPVNGVASLFSKITDYGVVDQVENASKETIMTEKKKLFYEAEEKLIKQAEVAYNAIKDYENYTTWTGSKITDEKFLNDFSSFIASPDGSGKNFEAIYKDAHTKMVMNLYNTHKTDGTLSITLIKRKSISNPGTITTYSDSNKASASRIQTLLANFNSALKNYKTANSNLNTSWNTVGKKLSSDYPIQYWVALTNECSSNYSTYASRASTLWSAAKKLDNAISYAQEGALETLVKKSDYNNGNVTYDEVDSDGKLSLQSLCDSFLNYYNSNFKSDVEGYGSSAFKNIGSQIDSVNTDANNNKLKLESVSHVYNIMVKMTKYQNDFRNARDKARTAKAEVYKLKNLLTKYKEAFSAWKTAAFDSELDDSTLATGENGDRKTIQQLEATGIELFSEDSVTKLYERLGNIYDLFQTFYEDTNDIKYKSTAVDDISNYAEFRTAANLNSNKIVRTKTSLESYANESFSFSIGTEIQRIEIHDNKTSSNLDDGDAYVITDSFHPNIQKTRFELYEWMKKKFEAPTTGFSTSSASTGFDVSDKSSAKDAKSSMSGKSEDTSSVDTSENTTGNNFKDWSGATLPSKGEGAAEEQSMSAKLSEVSDYVSSIFSNFSGTFKNSLVNMRDDLFVMDYMFNMFTYDTFDNEGCYSLLDDASKKNLTPSTAKAKYQTVSSQWKSSDEIKTLTLTPRNTANNWAYGGEIEYILYGNGSNASNKTTAYANIYMIRYALDLPAVFNAYWDDVTLNIIANSLQAFAYIPVPLTKTIACLAITAAEAAIDINYLRNGLPVMLVKIEKDDIVCNYRSVFMGQSSNSTDITDKITLQYSDYLKIFMYIKLLGSGENMIYTRIADVIQANMTLASKNANYALSKAQVYYDIEAKVLVTPMWSRMLAIDDLGDLSTEKDWRSIKIKITRGY